ncbi:MAG: T9SS type A sorting domain-containing protein [Chitinophagales bacterium]
MKQLSIYITFLCLLANHSFAQEITGMEYFFDSDPGAGNGIFVDITDTDELDLNYTFPLDGLVFGLHDLYIRLQDSDGNWSLTNKKQFLFFEGNTNFEIDGLEYFVDEDPGIGEALFVDLPNSPVINQAVNLDLSSFQPGFHLLYIRIKDTNGSYSLAMAKPIFISNGENNSNTLARLEYFIDDDPGYGNGRQIALNNASEFDDELELDLSGVAQGIHQLFLRVQDNYGAWSLSQRHQIVVFPGNGMELNLTQIEYYYDEDPGFGNGFQVNVNSAIVDSNLVFVVPENLSLGEHILHVRAKDQNGRWSHINSTNIFACPGGPAQAGFRPIRFGNTFSFVDTSKNVLTYSWDFGDGSTSTLSNPIHEFGFGAFTITQIVENGCNSDTAYFTVEVKGVEDYTPKQAGLGGDIFMTIYGGGFDENTTIQIVNGSTIINASETNAVNYTTFNAMFDLHFTTTSGYYDLIIDIDGVDVITIEDAILINEAIYPKCISTIEGPDVWRRNRNTTFELVIENTGNINAKGVATFLLVPSDVEITILAENKYSLYDTTETFIYYDSTTAKVYDIEYDEVRDIVEGLRYDFIEIDSFNRQPYNGKIYDLLIPNIPGNSSISIPFRAISSTNGDMDLKTFTANINLFGSPATPQWCDMVENLGDMGLDAAYNMADESNNKWLQALLGTAKAGREHLKLAAQYYGMKSGGVSSGEAYAKVYGGGALDKANAYALKTAGEIVADQGLGQLSEIDAAAISRLQGRSKEMAKRILKSDDVGMRNMRQRIQDRLLDQIRDATTEAGRRDALWNAYKKINDYNDAKDYLTKTLQFLDACPDLNNVKDDILNELDKMLNQEDEKTKKTEVINATDPNAIYGPQGYNATYIKNNRNTHYIVAFENVDTATAAAQIVEIYDTIDVSKFDASTFEFSHVMIAGELIRFPNNRQQYVTEHDMRPEKDLIVRINATFNDSTGIIYWKLFSLDPNTGDLVTDPFAGFLNPNVTSPEGEGSVSYNVMLKSDLVHNTTTTNRASIIFDDNDAILTNTWQNTIDDVAPSSNISADYHIVNDSTVMIGFEGSDEGSGIKFYEVYVSNNNQDFIPYASSFGDSILIERGTDPELFLYCIAVDSVGLKETKNSADIMVMFSPTAVVENLLAKESILIYPNPNNGIFYLRSKLEHNQEIKLQVADIQGKIVHQSSIDHPKGYLETTIIPDKIYKGIYFVKITDVNGKILATDKLIVQ